MGTPTRCKYCKQHPAECSCGPCEECGGDKRLGWRWHADNCSTKCPSCGWYGGNHGPECEHVPLGSPIRDKASGEYLDGALKEAQEECRYVQELFSDCAVCGETKQAHYEDEQIRLKCYEKMGEGG